MDLALREPPKDAIQPVSGEGTEVEGQSIESAEAETENNVESQNEPETKSKDKVTLKELASQSEAVKASQENISDSVEIKPEGTDNEPALEKADEIENENSQIETTAEVDKISSEEKEPVSESADKEKEKQSDLAKADDTQPISEAVTVTTEEKQPMVEVVAEVVSEVEQREITEDEVKANLKEKEAMMLQEDTTDSEVLYS